MTHPEADEATLLKDASAPEDVGVAEALLRTAEEAETEREATAEEIELRPLEMLLEDSSSSSPIAMIAAQVSWNSAFMASTLSAWKSAHARARFYQGGP